MIKQYKFKECPLESSINLIKRKWLLLILRDIYEGKTHFNEFKEKNPGISNKVLSNCLKYMEDKGLISKINKDPENKFSTEYHLTNKGKKINKVLYELAMFTVETNSNFDKYDQNDKNGIREYFKDKYDIEYDMY